MTGVTRGRRLPPRVYWVRRLAVLGVAVLLVVGIAQLLGGSGGGSSGPDRAATVADTSTGGSHQGHRGAHHHHVSDPTTQVATPSGPCAADDIAVTPSVPHPIAGGDISLVLDVSTITSPACDWKLSGRTLALKITSGQDLIWTTLQCAQTIPTEDLVLRRSEPTRVKITWDARRSEAGCPRLTEWALPGTYHLDVAALAGQPQEVTFVLQTPTPAEITQTAQPHHHAEHHHKKHQHKKHRHQKHQH